MAGTKEGAAKMRETVRRIYGDNYWKNLGKKGGAVKGKASGFASQRKGADGLTGPERARIVGAKGGAKSKRKGKYNA